MKKALLRLLASGLVIGMLACSSDKNTNPPKTAGDPNDFNYLNAKTYAMAYVDSVGSFAAEGYDYMTFSGTMPQKTLGDSASIVYDDSSHWWMIYGHHDTTGVDMTFRDSVRFEAGDSFQFLPDTLTTTGFEYRADADVYLVGDSSAVSGILAENFHATGLQSEEVTLNGDNSADLGITLPRYSYAQNYDGAMTDVIFNKFDLENEPNPHPVSGSIALSMLVESSTPQGSSSVSWDIGITFYVDHYHIHFESGDNYWDLDVQYGG